MRKPPRMALLRFLNKLRCFEGFCYGNLRQFAKVLCGVVKLWHFIHVDLDWFFGLQSETQTLKRFI